MSKKTKTIITVVSIVTVVAVVCIVLLSIKKLTIVSSSVQTAEINGKEYLSVGVEIQNKGATLKKETINGFSRALLKASDGTVYASVDITNAVPEGWSKIVCKRGEKVTGGFLFELPVPAGSYTLTFSYLGVEVVENDFVIK